MNNELDELIERHGYVVKVTLDEDDEYTVVVDFAGLKSCYYRVVIDEDNEIYGISYHSSLMDEKQEEFLPMAGFLVRLYILGDIYRQCAMLDLSREIVRYYNGEGNKVEFVQLLQLPLTEDELATEFKMDGYAATTDVEASVKAEKDGLLHHYNIMKAILPPEE